MIGSRFQKKRMLSLFIVLFALGLSSLTADTPRTLYTPRNTLVPDTYVCDEMSVADRDSIDDLYASLYPNAEQLTLWGEQYSSSTRYNCHGYAWHMIGDDAINDPVWIGYSSPGQVYKYWQDGSYDVVSSSIATTVKYSGDHSATTTDQPDIYISKWRFYPLMRHHKDYHPGYGTPNTFCRRSVDVPQDYSTIQSAINAAVSGQTVHVSSGTYSGNITMKTGVDVIGASKWSTHINGSVTYSSVSNTILQDLSVSGLIDVNYGSGNEINRVESKKTSGTTLDLYNSVIDIWQYDNTEGVNYAVYSHNSSNIDISYCTIYDANRALYTSGSSADIWGMAFCGNTYDIYRTGGGTIWIEDDNMLFSDYPEDCTYGVEEELPELYDICGGYKRITTSAPAGNSAQDPQPAVSLQNNEGAEEYSAGASIIREIKVEIREKKESGIETNRLDYASDYGRAICLFKQVIDRYPDNPWSINALSRIQTSYRELGEFEQLAEYADTLLDGKEYLALRPHVLNSLIPYHIHNNDYQKALQLSDEILANHPDDDLSCEVNYGKGIIYRHFLNDQAKASEIFKKVISSYSDHPTALSAQAELENMGEEYVPGDSTSTQLASGEPVIVSYPNPFNPSSTIRFALPEEGQVTLKVYDLLGREVATLVDGYMEPGQQQVVWNGKTAGGREVPVGIYIARLVTPATTRSIKLVLLK